MPRCARKGCGKEYDKDANTEESCSYHSGDPVRTPTILHLTPRDTRSHPTPHRSRFSMKGSNPGHAVTP